MMTATECPSIDRLRELTLGRLTEDDSEELIGHLRDCESCQSDLETMGDGEDSLIHAIRSPDARDGLTDEPYCRAAVMGALGAIARPSISADADDVPAFPVSIGEYEIVGTLGSGGMGDVFLARHTKLGRQVALKVLACHRLADAKMKERFEAEMRAVGRLSHPGIVTAHDAREIDGTAVLVTEFIDGLDLSQLMNRTGPLAIADACEIVRQVAVALQYTCDQGFVHRDVKPSNIMLGSAGEVKLLDLGLARFQDSIGASSELTGTELTGTELTRSGQAMGTADYIAPEQVADSHSVDVRADIYSLGCTLFKLLAGQPPYVGPDHSTAFAKMTAHVQTAPPSLSDFRPDAPSGLVKCVALMLAKDPEERSQMPMHVAEKMASFAKGADLLALIGHALTISPNQAITREVNASSQVKTQPWLRRKVPASLVIAAGFVGLLIGFSGGFLIRVKTPDGTVVTMNAPEGSEISIERDRSAMPVRESPEAVSSLERSTPFLKFGIVATKEETSQYSKDGDLKHYLIDTDADLPAIWTVSSGKVSVEGGFAHEGQRSHLIHESKMVTFDNQNLRNEIESATSKNGQINLRLSESAGEQIRTLTRDNLGRQLAIIVNGSIRMAPTIQSEVGRDLVITGKFTQEEIKYLMDSLGSGLVEPLRSPADRQEPVQR